MVIAVITGQVTPPMAIALVISGRLADIDQLRVFAANWPFLWGLVGFTLLLMLVPELATWLPNLLRE
jgi:TRAP-type C4-dicarboxylate transport system permease large subunit